MAGGEYVSVSSQKDTELAALADLRRGDKVLACAPSNLAVDNLLELLRANPALEPHADDPRALVPMVEEAWRSFHAGDFADAVERGLLAGPVGFVVATRAATVYAAHLEEDPVRRLSILREAVESAAALLRLAPNWANAWYAHGAALVRYSQHLSVVKALSQGLGSKVRDSLHRALQLEPGHAGAHVVLGVYNAEVIDKVGALIGGMTYGAKKDTGLKLFQQALKLNPGSAIAMIEYANALVMLEGDKKMKEATKLYAHKEELVGKDVLRNFEKAVMLQTLDGLWKEHLAAMDHLRQGIHLRGYAQKNPKQEYKRESFDLFTQMLETLKRDVVSILSRVQVQERDVEAMEEQQRQQAEAAPRTYTHAAAENQLADEETQADAAPVTFVRDEQKVGRNDPCPCGSGKKYKHCHGQLT